MENISPSEDKNNQPVGVNLGCIEHGRELCFCPPNSKNKITYLNSWMPVDTLHKNTLYPSIDIWCPDGVDVYGDGYNAHRKTDCAYDGKFWYNGEIIRKPVSHYMLVAEPK